MPIPIPPLIPSDLRLVTFKSVVDTILRQHGFDPLAEVNHDTLRGIVEQVNTTILYAWRYWEWPQLEFLQERAFRTRWNDTQKFLRVGFEGQPDELYYVPPPPAGSAPDNTDPTAGYYQVNALAPADPPAGTLPTNATYFTKFTPTNRYILLDQQNETPIGEVIEIFKSDPRLITQHDAPRVAFQPTEREVTVIGCANNTVFVQFRITPSQFTGVPFLANKAYAPGDRVIAGDDCFLAVIASPTDAPDAQSSQWVKIPFPAIFSSYVTQAAYAQGLLESDPQERDPNVLAHKRALAQAAQQSADDAIAQEVDRLRAQGQHYRYKRWRVPYNDPYWWTYPAVSPNAF